MRSGPNADGGQPRLDIVVVPRHGGVTCELSFWRHWSARLRRPRMRKGPRPFRWASSRPSYGRSRRRSTSSDASRRSIASRSEARVTGYLEAVLFKEGDLVKEGAAALPHRTRRCSRPRSSRPRARCERSKAQHELAREEPAARGGAAAKNEAGTEWRATRPSPSEQAAKGAIMTDEANLQTAKINLGYTDITSPIAGKIGTHQRHQGQCRRPGQRRADDDRQPGPDVCDLPGQPARIPARNRRRGQADRRQEHQGHASASPTASLYDQTGRASISST